MFGKVLNTLEWLTISSLNIFLAFFLPDELFLNIRLGVILNIYEEMFAFKKFAFKIGFDVILNFYLKNWEINCNVLIVHFSAETATGDVLLKTCS